MPVWTGVGTLPPFLGKRLTFQTADFQNPEHNLFVSWAASYTVLASVLSSPANQVLSRWNLPFPEPMLWPECEIHIAAHQSWRPGKEGRAQGRGRQTGANVRIAWKACVTRLRKTWRGTDNRHF